jgi:RHS repeat-associated protein
MTTPKHISSEYQGGLPRMIGQNPAQEFTGKVYGVRYYLSELSVWLSVDSPLGKYPGVSSFVYVLGNPIKFIDPDGMRVSGGEKGMNPDLEENTNGSSNTNHGTW